jgi:hypothetical protein
MPFLASPAAMMWAGAALTLAFFRHSIVIGTQTAAAAENISPFERTLCSTKNPPQSNLGCEREENLSAPCMNTKLL